MRHPIYSPQRLGFTIIELLIAMTLGMFVSSVATSAFYYTRKAMLTAETVAAKNNVTQSMMLWVMDKKTAADFPRDDQSRGVSGVILEVPNPDPGYGKPVFHLLVVDPARKQDPTTTRTDGQIWCPWWGDTATGATAPEGTGVILCTKCSSHYLWTKRSGNTISSCVIDIQPLFIPKTY